MSIAAGRRPRVSVCIPAYNRRDILRATLQSVLRQTFTDLEIVISDNASDDDLAEEIGAVHDPRLRYIRQPRNLGAAGNFHFLEGAASGEYVLFLCSDDLLLPHCLAKAVEVLDADPSRGAVVYMAAMYGDGGYSHVSHMPSRLFATRQDYDRDQTVRDFRYAAPSLCLYRLQTFLALGGWDKRLQAAFDWEMYARTILRGGGVAYLREILAIMRLHEDRVSTTSALGWGFYHDAMLLAAPHEYRWGGPYRAMAFVEQFLLDWRTRRSPSATFRHARRTGATLDVLFFLPYELLRRAATRLRRPTRATARAGDETLPRKTRETLDALWRASEAMRAGR